MWITEESRESHMHIIGTTGMGKSYFLLKMMVDDINRGNGLCFLDPSFNGNTMKMVLSYCASIGFEKVLIVDPHSRYDYNRITPLNLFYKHRGPSVSHIYDTIRVLFDMKNQAMYSFIEQYMPALLGVLWNADLTLYESIYFSDYYNPFYKNRVNEILERSELRSYELKEEFDADGITIGSVFKTPTRYEHFGSTIRRLNPFYKQDTLKLMFGARERIDFTKLIKEGWVILVNLHQGFGITPLHSKLVGTAVINELMFAIERLNHSKWKGRYYLYIDEAGEYANDKLVNLLYYKRQSGLAVILAHQLSSQFSNPEVKKAIQGLTRMKVAFYQPDQTDRLETVKMLYGGELKDADVSFSLKHLKKREAVVMTDDRAPKIIRVPQVEGNTKPPKSFIEKLYRQSFYVNPDDVIEDQKRRFAEVSYRTQKPSHNVEQRINEDRRKNTPSSKQASKTNRRTTGKDSLRQPQNASQSVWATEAEQFKRSNRTSKSDAKEKTGEDVETGSSE